MENRKANHALIDLIKQIATQKDATPAQIALAWIHAQKPWIVPIPGTTKIHRLIENIGVEKVELSSDDLLEIEEVSTKIEIHGARYPESIQKMVDND